MHECSHGTAFRTRWLNEAAYWLVSLVYISQPTWYRYRHAVHHTYTQIQGKDPAMVLPGPTTWQHYFEQLLGWRFWTTFPVAITKHALGTMRPQDSWYVPKTDLPRIHNEARIMIAVYGVVAGAAIYFGSFAPLIYWLIPRMMGEPLQRAWRIAEHKGCDEGPDVRTNTRSTKASLLMRAAVLEHAVPFRASCLSAGAVLRVARGSTGWSGDQLHPMGEEPVGRRPGGPPHLHRISRASRTASSRSASAGTSSVDTSWICALD